MRRDYIYPHRSFRSVRVTASRLLLASFTAAALCGVVVLFASRILAAHSQVCSLLLNLSGVPAFRTEPVQVFPSLGPVTVPATLVLQYGPNPLFATLLFIGSVLVLLAIHRRVALARTFILFLITLLVAAAAVIAFVPGFRFSSSAFTQIWLRGEVLVWLVLPWVSAFLFVLIHPSALAGVAWVLAAQVYGFVWSALRLTFCLGVLHHTGILFLPLLWFCLGLLADVLYVIVLYSAVVGQACRTIWGKRASWQS